MNLKRRESVILAEDFSRLGAWYQEILGFKMVRLFEDGYHYAYLKNEAGIEIGIAPAAEMGVTIADRKGSAVILQFEVADVSQFFTYIEERGGKVTFGPSLDKKDQFWYGGFADPEGNQFWVVDGNCP